MTISYNSVQPSIYFLKVGGLWIFYNEIVISIASCCRRNFGIIQRVEGASQCLIGEPHHQPQSVHHVLRAEGLGPGPAVSPSWIRPHRA